MLRHNSKLSIRVPVSALFIALLSVLVVPAALALAADAPHAATGPALAEPATATATIELDDFLVLPAVGNYGRLPLHQDAVEAEIVSGQWQPPSVGATVELPDGEKETWRAATADDGTLDTQTLRGGYAYATFDSPAEGAMLLAASGHAAVYVNGELRTGDPYELGWLRLPVLVRKGRNTLLFHLAGDQLKARLTQPPSTVYFMKEDRTLPTLAGGEEQLVWGAVPVVNASREWLRDLQIECQHENGDLLTTPVAPIAPLSVQKVGFRIPPVSDEAIDHVHYTLRLSSAGMNAAPLATTELEVKQVGPNDVQIRTFRSRIDGSVQPYAVRPARGAAPAGGSTLPGMIVTLHDAGVDCAEQVARYEAKDWAHVVAPQGRRPYGFDWEDWGRIDALEALADARLHYPSDLRRTDLTGQAMGGHGVWHLGVTYPDLFAAIAPSDAWASFWSYGGGMPSFENPTPIESLILRGYSPSDTVALLSNLAGVGVYLLHGEADAAVPVAQARFMRSRLANFHANFAYFESAGPDVGSGDETADWPPLMEFFQRQVQPNAAERTAIDFTTADPGISSRYDWVTIAAQHEPLKPSRAVIRQDVETRTFVGQSSNVARLGLDVSHLSPGQSVDVTLDGQQMQWIPWPERDDHRLWFERSRDGDWQLAERPSPRLKGPERNGLFKSAFDHGALLVYGTVGNDEENRWAEAKARYDAETFWYRGGGSLELMPDKDFDVAQSIGRSAILYGNADTNSAWPKLLASCPVQVHRGEVRVGDRTVAGDDLAVLMVYPRSDGDAATVGVVAGTGPAGMALTNRICYFVSGIAYPDLLVSGANILRDGASNVRVWGYFGPNWSFDSSDVAWLDGP
jgi:hypothetical protein